MTLTNWVSEYMQMNLTRPTDAMRVERPSRMTSGTHEMLGVLDVNGLAIDASAWDNEMPAFALFKAYETESNIFYCFVFILSYQVCNLLRNHWHHRHTCPQNSWDLAGLRLAAVFDPDSCEQILNLFLETKRELLLPFSKLWVRFKLKPIKNKIKSIRNRISSKPRKFADNTFARSRTSCHWLPYESDHQRACNHVVVASTTRKFLFH